MTTARRPARRARRRRLFSSLPRHGKAPYRFGCASGTPRSWVPRWSGVPQRCATSALTTSAFDGYTRGMGTPDGHERVSIDIPSDVIARLDKMTQKDQISRHARMRLMLSLGSLDDDLLGRVAHAALLEARDAPPKVDPRRG